MWPSSWMNCRTRVRPESVPDRSLRWRRPNSDRRSGQVAVRAQVAPVDDRALGAVHRLEREGLALALDEEHVLLVEVPVAGGLPQALADHHRRGDLEVAAAVLDLAHGGLERPPDALALGVPERRAGAHVVEAEQVELHAQLAVVALLRLLAPPQELVELLLALPDRPVDPLEHRALLVAPPVGAGDGEQLERPDVPRGFDVRALAQVAERAVLVEGHRRQRLAATRWPCGRGRRGSRP